MRKAIRIIVLLSLLSLVCGFACAETVELPESLAVIRAEAFAGDASIETVIVPEGLTEIGERAFANSGLKLIQLPSTLQTIADDAFAGFDGLNATAPEDSHAYNWCLENNIPVQSWLQTTPASHFQYDAYTSHGVQGWKIDGCNTQLADVVVPNEIEGKPVLFVTEEYHEENEALRSIYYPDTAVLIETGQAKNM